MASASDYLALSARIAAEQTNLSVAVESCAAIGADQKADWYYLARRCLAYVSYPSLADSGAGSWDALLAQGNDLWLELATWRATLEGLGCVVPTLSQTPAAPPKGRPGSGWGDLWGLGPGLQAAAPFVLAWLVLREWNESRRR